MRRDGKAAAGAAGEAGATAGKNGAVEIGTRTMRNGSEMKRAGSIGTFQIKSAENGHSRCTRHRKKQSGMRRRTRKTLHH